MIIKTLEGLTTEYLQSTIASFVEMIIGTFRSQDEDEYQYEFSVLSIRIRFGDRHFSKCACSEQKTRWLVPSRLYVAPCSARSWRTDDDGKGEVFSLPFPCALALPFSVPYISCMKMTGDESGKLVLVVVLVLRSKGPYYFVSTADWNSENKLALPQPRTNYWNMCF